MKKLIFILGLFLLSLAGYAQIRWFDYFKADYFVSATTGSDTNDGTAPWKAWATIAKVNATTFSPGDRIAFRTGDTWREALTVGQSGIAGNPITYKSYGTGANPVIDGADAISYISPLYNSSSVWSATLTTNLSNTTYYNIRVGVTPAASGTKVRLKFNASTGMALNITGASIGKRLGTTSNFDGAPTRLTFSGIDSVTIATSNSTFSDGVDFVAEAGVQYLVHIYMRVPNMTRYVSGSGLRYLSTSKDNNTMTETVDYTNTGTSTIFVTDMQVLTTVENMYAQTSTTTQPFIMWYNDTIAPLAADTASLDVDGEWFWNTGDNTFYMYATSNPSGKVELGQRGQLINASNRNYITVSNLTLQHSNENNTVGFGSPRSALYMEYGSHLTVRGCTVQDNSLHGVYTYNSSDITIDNNTLLRNGTMNWNGKNAYIRTYLWGNIGRNYTFTNNISSHSGRDGIMLVSTDITYPLKHIIVSGNTFEYNFAAGCYPINSDSTVISNNIFNANGGDTNTSADGEDYSIAVQSGSNIDIYNNTITNQVYNDAIQVWASPTAPAHNVRVFRNYVNGVTAGDCLEIIASGSNSMENCEIFSNVFTGASASGITIQQDDGNSKYPVLVYNNTIDNNDIGIYKSSEMPIVIKNNIFTGGRYNIYAWGDIGSITGSNNLWFGSSIYALTIRNVSNYSTANITNFEASAQNTDPLFVKTGTYPFLLQSGSPAINAGVDVGLTRDILGNPIVGNPDIGAYEKQ